MQARRVCSESFPLCMGSFRDPRLLCRSSGPIGRAARPCAVRYGWSGSHRARSADNPLVLSGLVLAGANRPAAGFDPLSHDDLGILTAEVIASMPLQGLELAVLSACETGLGQAAGGEGVFGLQRDVPPGRHRQSSPASGRSTTMRRRCSWANSTRTYGT